MATTRSLPGSSPASDEQEDPEAMVRRILAEVAAMSPEERERHRLEFFEILDALRDGDGPPMSMEEIQDEVRAARAELRARRTRP